MRPTSSPPRLQVLLLEGGKKLPSSRSCARCSGRYDHPRRGDEPRGRTTSRSTSTRSASRRTPRARRSSTSTRTSGMAGFGLRQEHHRGREGSPYTGTNYAWVRARCLGARPTSGAVWRSAVRLRLQGQVHDGYGEDWPILLRGCEPYYDKVDLYSASPAQGEPAAPAGQPVPASSKLNVGEVKLRESLKKGGQVLTPYRAGVTTDGLKHNKYRQQVLRAGRLRSAARRVRHPRRVRFAPPG